MSCLKPAFQCLGPTASKSPNVFVFVGQNLSLIQRVAEIGINSASSMTGREIRCVCVCVCVCVLCCAGVGDLALRCSSSA